jgi:hypothetical protein
LARQGSSEHHSTLLTPFVKDDYVRKIIKSPVLTHNLASSTSLNR